MPDLIPAKDGMFDRHPEYVEMVGIFKPHPPVYKLAIDRLGVMAEEIFFVSANVWDASGSNAFGIRVAWINRFDQRPERLPYQPDVEIKTLADLPRLLIP